MPTNAQAALAAASTIFSGARGYATTDSVIAAADRMKAWLDQQDAAEPQLPEQREVSLDALVERADPAPAAELRIGFAPRR